MKRKQHYISRWVMLLVMLGQLFVPMFEVFAANYPTGKKEFSPVGIDVKNRVWNDGVPLGGSYLEVESSGIIKGFAKDSNGSDWNGQKYRNTTDNVLAYCLNFNQPTPTGEAWPLDDLTSEQKQQLSNLLKLGYVEIGTNVYKGQGVTTLSNIDAYTTTQWMVHEIVPTWDMSEFTITNPQLKAGVDNLKQWIHEDLSIVLEKGTFEETETAFIQTYTLSAPFNLQGNAVITIDQDIAGAMIVANDQESVISTESGETIDVGTTFKISVPKEAATNKLKVRATGGTTEFTFMKYDRPAGTNQQQSLVIGEEYIGDSEIAESEMEWVQESVPNIQTLARDQADGDKKIAPIQKAVIEDEVRYENLQPGKAYTVTGKLMDKASAKPLLINGKEVVGETTFTAEKASGSVIVTFRFDARALSGKELVVFEKLYHEGKEIAVHEDITDEGQTVIVEELPPSIQTLARDQADGDKKIAPIQKAVIEDEVRYENLQPGKAYTVTGKLMDKASAKPLLINGKEVVGETTFTAEKASGSVIVTFRFDARALSDKELVVFEKLYHEGKEIAVHEDITDENQTVFVTEKEKPVDTNKPNRLPQTNETRHLQRLFSLIGVIMLAVIIWAVKKRMKNYQ